MITFFLLFSANVAKEFGWCTLVELMEFRRITEVGERAKRQVLVGLVGTIV